jgi:hypothetical protein
MVYPQVAGRRRWSWLPWKVDTVWRYRHDGRCKDASRLVAMAYVDDRSRSWTRGGMDAKTVTHEAPHGGIRNAMERINDMMTVLTSRHSGNKMTSFPKSSKGWDVCKGDSSLEAQAAITRRRDSLKDYELSWKTGNFHLQNMRFCFCVMKLNFLRCRPIRNGL